MRKFLIVLATAIFLYSPLGPSWGRKAVNMGVVLSIFGFYAKHIPKRRYRQLQPMFSTFSLATFLQITLGSFGLGYLTCAVLHSWGFRIKRQPGIKLLFLDQAAARQGS